MALLYTKGNPKSIPELEINRTNLQIFVIFYVFPSQISDIRPIYLIIDFRFSVFLNFDTLLDSFSTKYSVIIDCPTGGNLNIISNNIIHFYIPICLIRGIFYGLFHLTDNFRRQLL